MKKSSLLFFGLFAITPAMADVASTANVDAMRAEVQTKIDALANNSGYTANRVLQTDGNGNVVAGLLKTDMIADGAIQTMHIADGTITDADLAAGLELDKLDWGTLPTDGNMYIPIWNSATNEYVFELYEYVAEAPAGLQCIAPSYDVGASVCINKGINADEHGYWDFSALSADNCTTCKAKGDWEVRYTSGTYNGVTISGKALCSSTNGTFAVAGNPNKSGTGTTRYCWCKLDNNTAVSRWVPRDDLGSASVCAESCAYYCCNTVAFNADFRLAMFESVGQGAEPEPEPEAQCIAPEYDLGLSRCINLAASGTAYGFRNDGRGDYSAYSENTDTYGLTTDQTWGVTFEGYGNVKGIASCNDTPGEWATATNQSFSQSDTGQYCWCKMTEPAVSRWVFGGDYGNASDCAHICALNCGFSDMEMFDFRLAVFDAIIKE